MYYKIEFVSDLQSRVLSKGAPREQDDQRGHSLCEFDYGSGRRIDTKKDREH